MLDYIRDGQEIYRNSFAIIRREANLAVSYTHLTLPTICSV